MRENVSRVNKNETKQQSLTVKREDAKGVDDETSKLSTVEAKSTKIFNQQKTATRKHPSIARLLSFIQKTKRLKVEYVAHLIIQDFFAKNSHII